MTRGSLAAKPSTGRSDLAELRSAQNLGSRSVLGRTMMFRISVARRQRTYQTSCMSTTLRACKGRTSPFAPLMNSKSVLSPSVAQKAKNCRGYWQSLWLITCKSIRSSGSLIKWLERMLTAANSRAFSLPRLYGVLGLSLVVLPSVNY